MTWEAQLVIVAMCLICGVVGFCFGWDERGMKDAEDDLFARLERVIERMRQW